MLNCTSMDGGRWVSGADEAQKISAGDKVEKVLIASLVGAFLV